MNRCRCLLTFMQQRNSVARVGGVAIAALVAVGCSESKVSQCNRLIEIANQAATEVETVTEASTPDDTEAFLQIAETADRAASDLEAIELDDEQLQGFRERFIALYQDTSEATRSLVAAVDEQNLTSAEEAYTSLENATSQEGPLVDEVNTYCGATEN